MNPENPFQSLPTESLVTRAGKTTQAVATRTKLTRLSVSTMPLTGFAPGEEEEDLLPGIQYELVERVGRGGMGEVYSAFQVSLGRMVAVKRLRGSHDEEADTRLQREAAFRQEAITAGLLEHPNILPVHDLGADEAGAPLLAMKLIDGKSWQEIIGKDGLELPVADFLAKHLPILISVAQAVAFAHSRGVVHRDLKPSQVMVGEFGEVLLTDWGLAIHVGEEQAKDARLRRRVGELPRRETASGPSGTPALMAPEQTLPSAHRIGPWTDVYLLGSTLYFLLTGTYPHQGTTMAATLALAERGDVEAPRVRRPEREIPADLEQLCLHCMERDPERRVASASDFVKRIQDFLSGASRRRQSAEMTAAISERIARPDLDYEDYAEGLAKLGDARALWPENPDTESLRGRLYTGYAEEALAHGDRVLAASQARSLREGPERDRLLAEVEKAEARVRRRDRQRRAAFVAVMILMGAVGVLGLWAQRQRIVAEEARTRAEDLMSFMVNDLKDGLRPIGKLGLLEQVADKARDYFDTLPSSLQTPTALRQKAQTLQNVGDVYQSMGRNDAMLAAHKESIELRRRISKSEPSDAATAALARALYRTGLGLTYMETRFAECEALLKEAEGLMRGLLRTDPDRDDWNRLLGEIIDYRITVFTRTGEGTDEARKLADEGLELRLRFSRKLPDSYYWARNVGVSMERLADVLEGSGEIEEAKKENLAVLDYRRGLLNRFPAEPLVREDLGLALMDVSVGQTSVPQPEASKYLMEAVDIFTLLMRQDSANVSWVQYAAESTRLAAVNQQDPEEALRLARSAAELSRRLVGMEPKNSSFQNASVDSQFTEGIKLAATGAGEEAVIAYDKALAAAKAMSPPSNIPTRNSWTDLTIRIMMERGRQLQVMGKKEEAGKAMLDNIGTIDEIAKRDRGLPQIRLYQLVSMKRYCFFLLSQGNEEEAMKYFPMMAARARTLIEDQRATPALHDYLGAMGTLMAHDRKKGLNQEAAKWLEEALKFADECVAKGLRMDGVLFQMASMRRDLGACLEAVGRNSEVADVLKPAFGYLDMVEDKTSPDYWEELAFLSASTGKIDDATSITQMLIKQGKASPALQGLLRDLKGETTPPAP